MSTDRFGEFDERSAHTASLIDQLLSIVVELETIHPGRRFPLDGHLVGSIGEAAAEALFDLRLVPASTAGHDAITSDGRSVEVKATFVNGSIGLRATSHEAAAVLIVLRLSRDRLVPHEVVYNGPLTRVAGITGRMQKNGQAAISLNQLRKIDAEVPDAERVPRRGLSCTTA